MPRDKIGQWRRVYLECGSTQASVPCDETCEPLKFLTCISICRPNRIATTGPQFVSLAGCWVLHVAPAASLRGVPARRTANMTQHTNAFPEFDRELRFIPLGVEEPRGLTPAQIRRYNEAGHLFPIDIFSPAEIAETRA